MNVREYLIDLGLATVLGSLSTVLAYETTKTVLEARRDRLEHERRMAEFHASRGDATVVTVARSACATTRGTALRTRLSQLMIHTTPRTAEQVAALSVITGELVAAHAADGVAEDTGHVPLRYEDERTQALPVVS